MALDKLERRPVGSEIDVPVDGVQRLRGAQKQRQRLIVDEPVDAARGKRQPGRRCLPRELRVQRFELGDDRPGAKLAALPDEGPVLLQRRRVGGLRCLLEKEEVPLK